MKKRILGYVSSKLPFGGGATLNFSVRSSFRLKWISVRFHGERRRVSMWSGCRIVEMALGDATVPADRSGVPGPAALAAVCARGPTGICGAERLASEHIIKTMRPQVNFIPLCWRWSARASLTACSYCSGRMWKNSGRYFPLIRVLFHFSEITLLQILLVTIPARYETLISTLSHRKDLWSSHVVLRPLISLSFWRIVFRCMEILCVPSKVDVEFIFVNFQPFFLFTNTCTVIEKNSNIVTWLDKIIMMILVPIAHFWPSVAKLGAL